MIEIIAVVVAVLSLVVNGVQYFWSRQLNEELEYANDKFGSLVKTYIDLRDKYYAIKNKDIKKPIKRQVSPKKKGPGRPAGSKNKK